VRVRPNKSCNNYSNDRLTHVEDNHCHDCTDTTDSAHVKHADDNHRPDHTSRPSTGERPLKRCHTFIAHIMRQKSKQVLVCLVLAIIVTLLAAINNGGLRTRKTPNPTKLFDEDLYPIVDYEFGDLRQLSLRALQNDVSFVM
ncbi:unnamed protein product, partial [Oppiella nova]